MPLLFYFFVLLVTFCICISVLLFFLAQIFAQFTVDAPFVPIPDGINEDIIKNLKLTDTSVLYDLGCGDARILIEAVRKKPHIRAVGIEKAFLPYLIAKWKTRHTKIEIKREDIFSTNPNDATHIFVYLYPQVLGKLLPLLKEKCRPGTRIVSCDFRCINMAPVETIPLTSLDTRRGKNLFVYEL